MQPLALAMILSVARVSEWVSAVEAGRRRVFTRTGLPVRGALVDHGRCREVRCSVRRASGSRSSRRPAPTGGAGKE